MLYVKKKLSTGIVDMPYIVLYIDRVNNIFGKGKEHMSYSAYSLWKSNKGAYRRRYYEGEKPFETVETLFGKKVAEMMENRDPSLQHIPHYSVTEHPLECYIGGNKVVGYLDSFDPEKIRFLDHKSSHKDKNGKVPWDKNKVRNHAQLPFYSMMLKEIYGKVDNACHIVWIETEFKDNVVEFDGHILKAPGRELQLTGKVKKFRRVIREWERKRIREDLLKVCNEVKQDYENYQRNKSVVLGSSQEGTQELTAEPGIL